jgi:hypothetical protein
MPRLLTLTFILLACFTLRAEEVSGTLTLDDGFVVFHANSVETKYDPRMIPGLKAVEFQKKSVTKGNQEVDISELVLQSSTGETITLLRNRPELITRITEGTSVRWLAVKK